MALHWNLSKVADYRTVCLREVEPGVDELRGVTHDLIWLTMAVGMGTITAKNIDEWEFRLRVLSMMPGREAEEMYARLTREVLEAHIGLETNVFPAQTRKQWMSRMAKRLERDALAAVRYSKSEASATA
jgi:hypothetical protein